MQLHVSVGLVQVPGTSMVSSTQHCKSNIAAVIGSWDASCDFCLAFPSLVTSLPFPLLLACPTATLMVSLL